MVNEFKYLNHILDLEDNVHHDLCPYIKDYESVIHPETLLMESKSPDEYTQKTLQITQKPFDQIMISWYRIGNYLSDEAKSQMDFAEFMNLQTQNRYTLNYYVSCRLPQLGPDN